MQYNLGEARVINSRYFKGQNVVWRRRKTSGGTVFTTRERIDLTGRIVTKRAQKQSEDYQPAKLLSSLLKALAHRRDAYIVSWELLFTIENKLCELEELSSQEIARATLLVLKSFDIDGYISYAHYQKDIVSTEEIAQALRDSTK